MQLKLWQKIFFYLLASTWGAHVIITFEPLASINYDQNDDDKIVSDGY